MAKRRLTHQQQRRIRRAQKTRNIEGENHFQGRVISHHGGEVEVQPDEPQQAENGNLNCNVRSNLGLIVCGDRVLYQQASANPAIVSILPRDNLLQRQDGFGQTKAIAANVSQLLICLALEPAPNLFLLDQYLLSAEQQDIDVLIVVNKIDLLDSNDPDPFDLQKIYQPIGYRILYTSIVKHQHIEELQQHCAGQVNVISGVSGVGKSSLTKAILPDQDIRIREISQVNREGRHTTRTSRLYHLPQGGDLIDTPGVRGFRPVVEKDKPIASGFREIEQQAQHCRFHNCRHINEPRCAVIKAVEEGQIHRGRYDNYLKLLQENDSQARF